MQARRPIRGLALGALAVLSAAGCGAANEPRVYFIDGYRSELGMRGRLVAVERDPSYRGLGRIVAEVLRGPTDRELDERGLVTGFPQGVRIVSVASDGETARIRLASAVPPQRWPSSFYASAQLVYTLTDLEGVERVALLVNGRRCCVYDMQSRPWRTPLTRSMFAGWQGAPEE